MNENPRRRARGRRVAAIPFLAAVAALVAASSAEAQHRVWITQFGGFSDEFASAVVRGPSGGPIVAGHTFGQLFSPSLGPNDAFLAGFDEWGGPQWGVQFGTNLDDQARRLAPANDGGVFVAGITRGSLGGPNAGWDDAWIARCDATGNRLWTRQFGTPATDTPRGLVSDGFGGVFIAGTTGPPPSSQFVGWIARYDGEGGQAWLRQYPSLSTGFYGAASDGADGFYTAWHVSAGGGDIQVGRFNADGDVIWTRQFGSPAGEGVRTLREDGLGGLFVTGFTCGGLAAPNAGEVDVWLARYDAKGNQLSIMQFGGPGTDIGEGICIDGFGGAFLAGTTTGVLAGSHLGMTDAWIAHTATGSGLNWIQQFGTPGHDNAMSVASAGPGRAFVTGLTAGNIAAGTGPPAVSPTNAWTSLYETCYPDCTGDGAQTVADFGCFQAKYVLGDPYADCNASGGLTIADFGCFQNKYVLGCP